MSKTTRMLSAQSCADKMVSYSFVSQIICKLSRILGEIQIPGKMKARHFFPMMGILFLLSLQLVACQIGGGSTASSGPPQAVASATPQTVAPGTTPAVTPGTKPVTPGTKPVTPGTKPVTPGTKPVTPGPDPNSPVAFAAESINTNATLIALSVNSIVVKMPDGNTLSMNVTSQTDLSDFDDDLPQVGDPVKVEAKVNADGSFTAAKLSHEQPNDPDINVITYQAVTTSAVGADDVIHFKVGLKSYSFTIPSSADLEDFNGNAQAIQANQVVNVKVEFNESEGTLLKVGKASLLEQSPQQ